MVPDLAAPMADRYDEAVLTTFEFLASLNAQNQASPGCRDGMDVDALETQQRICTRAPAVMGARHRVVHVMVAFWFWLLGR